MQITALMHKTTAAANSATSLVSSSHLTAALATAILIAAHAVTPVDSGLRIETAMTPGTSLDDRAPVEHAELLIEMGRVFSLLAAQQEMEQDVRDILYSRLSDLYL